MANNSANGALRDRAEAAFQRKQAAQEDGRQAAALYRTESASLREKTEKLKALRLAKEAADAAEKAAAGPKKPVKRVRKVAEETVVSGPAGLKPAIKRTKKAAAPVTA